MGAKTSYSRLEELRKVPCKLRFISVEPLLESLSDIDLTGFSWLLVGGMSGPTWAANKMDIRWAAEIYERSKEYPGVHYFFKQSSARRSEKGIDALGRYLGLLKEGKADLIRWIPPTDLPMLPLSIEKGHRFTDHEWADYQQAIPLNEPTPPSMSVGTQFVPVEVLTT